MKALIVLIALVGLSAAAQAQPAEPAAHPAETEFHAAVARYLALHDRVKSEVPSLTVTADGGEIARVSDMLFNAIKRSRQKAQRGEIFNTDVAKLITARLRSQLSDVDINRFLITINDEPTLTDRPSIHMRYPVASSLATTPTRVLAVLPPIPEALEYRFIGRALVLRDRDAAMIIDYIVDALPAK